MDTSHILVMVGSLFVGALIRHFFTGIQKKEAKLDRDEFASKSNMLDWQREQDKKIEELKDMIHSVEKQQLINKHAAAEAASHYKQCVNYKLKHNG